MKGLKEIVGIGALVLALGACSLAPKQEQKTETLWAKPISVQAIGGHGYGYVSIVVEHEKGKYTLCRADSDWWMGRISDIAALVDSEIKDGDDEFITLKGKYKSDVFEIESVTANGYTIKDEYDGVSKR